MRTVLLAAALWLPPLAGQAADTIRRCVAPDGTMVYTDQPCERLDAKPVAAPQPIAPRTEEASDGRSAGSTMNAGGALSLGGISRSDCVRRTDTLLFEIRAAVEARNVNRLASVYDWAGKSAGAASGILERLSRITDHPAAAVEFRYPEFDPYLDPAALPPPPPDAEARPLGVRIVQIAPGQYEPTFEEDLRLVRNAACWWVSF